MGMFLTGLLSGAVLIIVLMLVAMRQLIEEDNKNK